MRATMVALFGAVVTLASTAAHSAAQELVPRTVPSRNVEAFTLQSPTMGQRYDIVVGLPAGFRPGSDKRYSALIVTDGNATFPAALDATRSLGGSIDAPIVIGVGAPNEEGDTSFTRRRVYEFSPPNWAMNDPFGQAVSGLCQAYHTDPARCVGGAPQFLNFIVKELLPRLLQKYPIDPQQLGLFGLSAGGFFASWAIFQEISPFNKYIISSPAMAYGDGEIFRQEEHYAAGHKDLKVAIYMASGTLEMDDPQLEGVGKIVSGHAHFVAMLKSRKYPGLRLFTEMHQGLGHSDGSGTTLVRGMRLLYAK